MSFSFCQEYGGVKAVHSCRHIIFVDNPWSYSDSEQETISLILSEMKRSYVKHFCIAGDSYEIELGRGYAEMTYERDNRLIAQEK